MQNKAPVAPGEKDETVQSKEELLAALQQDFATSVNKVYVNSVGREFSFKEISVQEQKSITRMTQGNKNRKDIVYDAQCALINKAALDPDFDIYRLSDFDRTKIMIALYQENMFQNDVKFVCDECGEENAYRVDFSETLRKLDDYVLEKKEFEYENKHFSYKFELEYPSVRTVSKFHAQYCARHGNVPKKQEQANNTMTNLEYINLFITRVQMHNKGTGADRDIKLTDYKISDREDILAAFPQDVLYAENGVLKYVVNEYIKPVNDCFEKHECLKCGAIHEKEGTDQVQGFF